MTTFPRMIVTFDKLGPTMTDSLWNRKATSTLRSTNASSEKARADRIVSCHVM